MKKRKENSIRIRLLNRFSLVFHAAGSLVLNFLIEMISRHSFFEAWDYMTGRPLVFLYNALLIFMTSTIVYLFRRRTVMRCIVFGLWLFLGIVNGVLLANRVTPFTGPDLKLLDDLRKIIGGYVALPMVILILGSTLLVTGLLIYFWFKGPKYQGKRNWIVDILIVVLSIALFVVSTNLAISKRILSAYFGNIAFAYQDYGFPYCLTVTIFDTGISQPNKYSEKFIASLTEQGEEDQKPQDDVNIVFLQLESFFDPQTVNFLEISEDPIPYFHELMEEYSSGYYRVPSVGAGTANTEFESISGMSMRYFGPGEYPYKTILKETTCESIPYDLKEYGYATHAIHNNEASFYGRYKVYPMLGFDSFTSEEFMLDISDTTSTGWVKDHILTQEILNCLDSTEGPDYVYTVSVQGHGDYPTESAIDNPQITVTGAENREKNNYSWEYYCQQIREMDDFLRELTKALSDYPEKVVLVMYGDHLPTMGLETTDMDNHYLFQTQYVMWDNFGMEKEDKNLCAYQMGAEVMNRLGMHKGTLVNFHQSRLGTKDYQKDLEVLQYDLLYGKRYALEGGEPLEPVEMQMGVLPITLNSIRKAGDGMLIVEGENFTEASALEINGEVPEQKRLLFQGALIVSDVELKPGDTVAVVQLSSTSAEDILRRTPEIIWSDNVPEEKTDSSEETKKLTLLEQLLESETEDKQ